MAVTTRASKKNTAPSRVRRSTGSRRSAHNIAATAVVPVQPISPQVKLEKLMQKLQQPDVQNYLASRADSNKCKTAVRINQGIEIFLSKGGNVYRDLKEKFYKNNEEQHYFMTTKELKNEIKQRVVDQDGSLEDYALENMSLLLFQGKTSPQPIHCDTLNREDPTMREKFGIMMMSPDGKPGTVTYKMENVPAMPTACTLKYHDLGWHDMPVELYNLLQVNPESKDKIGAYAKVLYATPDRLVDDGPITVAPLSIHVMNGCDPHGAPASTNRSVLFFTLRPRLLETGVYGGDTQVTKEKLVYMLYKALVSYNTYFPRNARVYLLRKLANYCIESAKRGTYDAVMDLPPALLEEWEEMANSSERKVLGMLGPAFVDNMLLAHGIVNGNEDQEEE